MVKIGYKQTEEHKRKALETRIKNDSYPKKENHWNWQGGKRNAFGYKQIGIGGKYYQEHRLILEAFLKRKLLPVEKVHHINLDKSDNRVENLFICYGHTHHQIVHQSLEKAMSDAIKKGTIRFNPNTGEYYA